MDFFNSIGNALNPNTNSISSGVSSGVTIISSSVSPIQTSLNSSNISSTLSNALNPSSSITVLDPNSNGLKSKLPILTAATPISSTFKPIQDSLNSLNVVATINQASSQIQNSISLQQVTDTLNQIKAPIPPIRFPRGIKIPPPGKTIPPINIPKIIIPPPDKISPSDIFNQIQNNPTISPILNQAKDLVPAPLQPVIKTITSSLPNSITPTDITKAATNLINNNVTAPIDKTIIQPIVKGTTDLGNTIASGLGSIGDLFGGGGLVGTSDYSTYIIIGVAAIGAYFLLRKNLNK